MKLASVILDIQTQALEAPYTYALEDSSNAHQESLFSEDEVDSPDFVLRDLENRKYQPCVGSAVLVPLGSRKVVGFIVALGDYAVHDGNVSVPDYLADNHTLVLPVNRIKPIIATLSEPYFDELAFECALWLSQRYLAPLSSCIRLFVPPASIPRVVRAHNRWILEKPVVSEVDDRWVTIGLNADTVSIRKGALKQEQIMRVVRSGDVRISELNAEFGNVSSSIKSLEAKGIVRVEHRRKMRSPFDKNPIGLKNCSSESGGKLPELTSGQRRALEKISEAQACCNGSVVVLDGVTGSGKTEVYLRAIQAAIDTGKTAIVLVPEISLTPQTVARFRGRFGESVAVMHSRMSSGERFDQWSFISSGDAKVVVGARSALFTPLRNLSLVVIDEEHEGTYKQDSAPRYDSRDVAIWMMKRAGGTVVLGSATPSITTLYRARHESLWSIAELPERANGRPLPPVSVIDMAKEFGSGHRSMFARELITELRDELFLGHKAVMLLNQRGFAKFLLCRDCGFVPECPNCSTSLTFHERGNYLMCHHCGYRVVEPPSCPSCGSPYLKKFGAGTQRVEDELNALIAGFDAPANTANVIRMDADTTSKKGAHQKLLDQFAEADRAVLLGTQMIAKGLDFDDVTLVGVINADTQLHLPDFRAGERTFDLIQQVAGRAGRASLPGHVVVQTYEAQNLAVCAAANYDRQRFLDDELPKRQALRYPPFVSMANILIWGKSEDRVRTISESLFNQVVEIVGQAKRSDWTVMPAAPCLLSKLRNTYRWHIVIKASACDDIAEVLGPMMRSRKADPDVNVAVDIDPEDML